MRFVVPQLENPGEHPRAVRQAVAREQQAVRQAYAAHNARIHPLLPAALQQLQKTDLHDGVFRSLYIDPPQRTVQFDLLCGDSRQGMFDLQLRYQDIILTPPESSLLCLIAHETSSQIDWDEIDLDNGSETAPFIHRLRWNTGIRTGFRPFTAGAEQGYIRSLTPEMELRFGSLTIESTPCPQGREFGGPCQITIVQV